MQFWKKNVKIDKTRIAEIKKYTIYFKWIKRKKYIILYTDNNKQQTGKIIPIKFHLSEFLCIIPKRIYITPTRNIPAMKISTNRYTPSKCWRGNHMSYRRKIEDIFFINRNNIYLERLILFYMMETGSKTYFTLILFQRILMNVEGNKME